MASDNALVLLAIKVLDIETSGDRVASALMKRAAQLRQLASEAESNAGDDFEVIELVTNDFGFRERARNQGLIVKSGISKRKVIT
jgi:hypothetical protein